MFWCLALQDGDENICGVFVVLCVNLYEITW